MAEGAANVDLQSLLAAHIATDLQTDARAHSRYLQVMDRVYLSEFTEQSAPTSEKFAGLNAAAHVPVPQPWGPVTRT